MLEQKCHDDDYDITESNISYARTGTEMVNSGSLDDGSVGVKNVRFQRSVAGIGRAMRSVGNGTAATDGHVGVFAWNTV